MNETRTSNKDKNQHIQVFVRVRPLNNAEKTGKTLPVVEIPSSKEIIIYERPQDKISKKFTYDKVFGPFSKQIDIYNAVVSPMLEEVLAGYNCTVFAYGQTGTGKTYTMEGVSNDPTLHWQSDTTAGMIPRSLSHLFDELRLLDAQEYSVRVSFLELYNEELFDLLSATDDASKIRLFEDASKKGAVIIHGLEEVTVHNKSEVYKILENGSKKRQTAATLMNANSSRSHTVFSITVHIKENTIDGEELLKTGKLNLVDLAGSENVGRSGAVDRRAREAGNINQSLLTLGRVITALVERAPHIPYRESKLTRLLQESLGGRTKTSIIATISPASINLEETLSTLDYAHRAKNITNRPEINQKLSKKALLKEYTEEIERLRRDLLATRERNGVYLAHDNYTEMQALIECQGKEIEEKINHIKALEETMQNKELIFIELQSRHNAQTKELHIKKDELEKVTHVLKSTTSQLHMTERDRDEQSHLVENHVSTEKVLLSQAETLLNVADTAISDTHKLHDKIFRKKQVEQENENLSQRFRTDVTKHLQFVESDLSSYTQKFQQFCTTMKEQIDTQIALQSQNIDETVDKFTKEFLNQHFNLSNKLQEKINKSNAANQEWLEEEMRNVSSITEYECKLLSSISMKLAPKIEQLVRNAIGENIRLLHDDVSQRLESLSRYTKEAVNTIYNYRLKDRDRICESIKNIRDSVQNTFESQNVVLQKRQAFAKVMENLSRQFNELYKTENDHCYTAIITFNQVDKICNDVNDRVLNSCSENTEKENNLEEVIQSSIERIKSDVNDGTQMAETITEMTIEQSKMLVNEVQTDLSMSRDELMKYNSHVHHNMKKLQGRMEEDRNKMLTSVHDIEKLITDQSANHIESLQRQKTEAVDACTEIRTALEDQRVESNECSNRISSQIHATHYQVDKFFVEDLRHDVPTGSTPAKKDFSYPRKFKMTSPHERIIQRFRDARKEVGAPDDTTYSCFSDEAVHGDTTIKHVSDSNTLVEITVTSPELNNVKTSTPNNTRNVKRSNSQPPVNVSILKSASGSDISRLSISSAVHSDSDIYIQAADKENGVDEFIKPEKTRNKRLSKKPKETKRRVLGTYN